MGSVDYDKLSRPQKLAIFLIVIGPDTAAEVLRQFDDGDIEMICREMSNFSVVPPEMRRLSIEEFSPLVAESVGSTLGGPGYARRALEIAKGDQAATMVGRIAPTGGSSVAAVKDISEMDARQIFNLVRGEQPQTISFLLSYLSSAKSAEVFALLEPELREEVIERLSTIESTSLDLVSKIARRLGSRVDPNARPALHRTGGVRAVADLLNQLDKATTKSLLSQLEQRNATLSAAIHKQLFSFEDLGRLQPSDLQRVLREVDSSSLATAMKSASEPLRARIYGAISKRAAESLKEEIGMLGRVRLKDVEAAQDAVIQAVRRLEEAGEISLESEEGQGAVD